MAEIQRGAEEIWLEDELSAKLKEGKPLKLKPVSILPHQTYT